jgi:hypothetical protein
MWMAYDEEGWGCNHLRGPHNGAERVEALLDACTGN